VSTADDETVRLWDAGTGQCRHVLQDQNKRILSVAFSPKGDQIVHGCMGGPMKLSDVVSGECLHILKGHEKDVESMAYSSQGDLVGSASTDKTIRLWDVETGQCLAVTEELEDKILDVAWVETLDHTYVAACCNDGTVGMWQVRADGDQFQLTLFWRTTSGELNVKGASIQDVRVLSQRSHQLLKQHGAVGEPVRVLRDPGKMVVDMEVDPPSGQPEETEDGYDSWAEDIGVSLPEWGEWEDDGIPWAETVV
jgi:hypothetical protein